MSIRPILATVLAALAFSAEASAKTHHAGAKSYNVSDAALVKTLPGFNSSFATVNGIRLHYVAGGEGDPVFLLPGWPETWWSYHKIMPELAKRHRVISIDLRGMGSSDKPAGGYDKKSTAGDISELVRQLGYKQVDVIGHDSMYRKNHSCSTPVRPSSSCFGRPFSLMEGEPQR